ncbi:hypothetical protein EYB26_007848 [Talaromyces marneffei]|uniref:uncharacterized protein n=1 Tax=Talaromyces marneffei TaxID=37727 RepID=UPI0012A96443|nr:uncharacterized protein EYB26_007848 [Talaromyces marneffei]QGA20147.1 hypothetical protein EYB26_007848 [Talaromyces marneffei]
MANLPNWKELNYPEPSSNEKPIVLKHVEAETFTRFTEFAYRGTYVTPVVQNGQHSDLSVNISDEEDGSIERGSRYLRARSPIARTISPQRNNSASHRRFFEQFRSLNFYDVPAMVSVNPNIMFHAKLYVFATEFQILSLQRQCLSKLHGDLCEFYMNPSDVQILLDLIEYSYTHTARHELGEESPLRNLGFRYALCHIDKLVGEERFEHIVAGNGDLALDILKEALKAL